MENLPAVSDWIPEWKDPRVDSPPKGATILLMTLGGVVVRGQWAEDSYVAWYPFLKKPDWLKKRLLEAYDEGLPVRKPHRVQNTGSGDPQG